MTWFRKILCWYLGRHVPNDVLTYAHSPEHYDIHLSHCRYCNFSLMTWFSPWAASNPEEDWKRRHALGEMTEKELLADIRRRTAAMNL